MRERALYQPVKTFLEAQGYEVKGEVNGYDLCLVSRTANKLARPKMADYLWPAGPRPANTVSAPSAHPLARFQPVFASQTAITIMDVRTIVGVARVPIPA